MSTMPLTFSFQQRLCLIIAIVTAFIGAEIAVGFQTNSLAVVADAFHYSGDLITYVASLVIERVSAQKRPDDKPEIGSSSKGTAWEREDIDRLDALGGFFNGSFLFALGLRILLQGIERLIQPEELSNPMTVMIMGCVGLGINGLFALMLQGEHRRHDHDRSEEANTHEKSWTLKSVLLHILCDAMNNAALVLAAALIWKLPSSCTGKPCTPGHINPKHYADPACTIFISTAIIVLSVRLIKETGKALLVNPAWPSKLEDAVT